MSEPSEKRISRIDQAMTTHIDFPKPGILFYDIFPVMKDPEIFKDLISLLVEHIEETHGDVEMIMGLDARGFILGPLVAQRLGIGFSPIRKAGKLPGETLQASFTLEYGSDRFEVQKSCINAGQKVIIMDDLLATGGTMSAACKLMNELKAITLECIVVVELTNLKGRDKITDNVFSLIKKDG